MPTITLSIHGGKGCGDSCIWICQVSYDEFSESDHMWMPYNYIVVAIDEYGHLAGVWKYEKFGAALYSRGTWVHPKYRKFGIAKKMWEFGIAHEKPKKIDVSVISDRGYSLVESVKQTFPNIKWKIEEESDRKLRKLKK